MYIENTKNSTHDFFTGKILLFYLIFYAALAGFFGGLLAIFWQTLETEKPKWELSESIIGTNPGLGFRPMPPEANLGSTLVWYKANRPENMRYWHDTVDNFLAGNFLSRVNEITGFCIRPTHSIRNAFNSQTT